VHLLDGLLDGSLTFSEVKEKSCQTKALNCVTDAFLTEVGCTWEEAVETIPQYADTRILGRYKVVKEKPLPQDLKVNLTELLQRTSFVSIN